MGVINRLVRKEGFTPSTVLSRISRIGSGLTKHRNTPKKLEEYTSITKLQGYNQNNVAFAQISVENSWELINFSEIPYHTRRNGHHFRTMVRVVFFGQINGIGREFSGQGCFQGEIYIDGIGSVKG